MNGSYQQRIIRNLVQWLETIGMVPRQDTEPKKMLIVSLKYHITITVSLPPPPKEPLVIIYDDVEAP